MKFLTRHNIWKKKIELRIEYWGLEWFNNYYHAKELKLKWVSYLLLLPAYRPQIVLDCSYFRQTLPLATCFQFSIRSWKKMVLNWIYAIKVTTKLCDLKCNILWIIILEKASYCISYVTTQTHIFILRECQRSGME